MNNDGIIHELHDIVVEEVSLVDRPANLRRFLVVKRDNTMQEVKTDEQGNLTTEKAAGENEVSVQAVMAKALEELSHLNSIFEAAFAEEAEELAPLKKEAAELVSLLSTTLGLTKAEEVAEEEAEAEPAEEVAKEEETSEEEAVAEEAAEEVVEEEAADDLEKSEDDASEETAEEVAEEAVEEEVEKAGRKLSGRNEKELRGALENISRVLSGLSGKEKEKAKQKLAEAAAEAAKEEEKEKAEKSEDVDTAVADATLDGKVAELEATVAKQREELKALRKARPASLAVQAEGGDIQGQGSSQSTVAWPLDMNAKPQERF